MSYLLATLNLKLAKVTRKNSPQIIVYSAYGKDYKVKEATSSDCIILGAA